MRVWRDKRRSRRSTNGQSEILRAVAGRRHGEGLRCHRPTRPRPMIRRCVSAQDQGEPGAHSARQSARLGHGLSHGDRGPAADMTDNATATKTLLGRQVDGSREAGSEHRLPVGDPSRRRWSTAWRRPPPSSSDATATDDPKVRQRPGSRGAGSELRHTVEGASASLDAPRPADLRTKRGTSPLPLERWFEIQERFEVARGVFE